MARSFLLSCCAIAVFAAACASSPRSITAFDLPSSGTWREVSSPHFVLLTDVDSDTARQVVVRLELYRKLMLIAASEPSDPPHRVHVFYPAAAREVAGFPNRLQQSMTLEPTPWMVFASADFHPRSPELPNLVAIRYAELLTRSTLERAPRWFAAGWSVYLQAASIDEDRGQAVIGYPLRALESLDRFQTWRKQAVPLATLWASEERAPDGWHYAHGYEWAYFLRFRHPDRLADFLDRLGRGEEPRNAWSRTFFDLTEKQLEDQTIGFLGPMQRYKYQTLPIPTLTVRTTERAVTDAERVAMRARLELLLGGDRPLAESRDRAARRLRGALVHAPGNAELLLELARTDHTRVSAGEARTLATAQPRSHAAQLTLALALLDDAAASAERLAALESAAKLRPEDAFTGMLLAREYLLAKRGAEALRVATDAARRAPWSVAVAQVHASAAAAAGWCPEAVVLARRARELVEVENAHLFPGVQGRLEALGKDCASAPSLALAELGL